MKSIPEMVNQMLTRLIIALLLFGGAFFNANIAAASNDSDFSACISWCDKTYGNTFGQECCIKGCAKAFYSSNDMYKNDKGAWKSKCYKGDSPDQTCLDPDLVDTWKAGCNKLIDED